MTSSAARRFPTVRASGRPLPLRNPRRSSRTRTSGPVPGWSARTPSSVPRSEPCSTSTGRAAATPTPWSRRSRPAARTPPRTPPFAPIRPRVRVLVPRAPSLPGRDGRRTRHPRRRLRARLRPRDSRERRVRRDSNPRPRGSRGATSPTSSVSSPSTASSAASRPKPPPTEFEPATRRTPTTTLAPPRVPYPDRRDSTSAPPRDGSNTPSPPPPSSSRPSRRDTRRHRRVRVGHRGSHPRGHTPPRTSGAPRRTNDERGGVVRRHGRHRARRARVRVPGGSVLDQIRLRGESSDRVRVGDDRLRVVHANRVGDGDGGHGGAVRHGGRQGVFALRDGRVGARRRETGTTRNRTKREEDGRGRGRERGGLADHGRPTRRPTRRPRYPPRRPRRRRR